MNIISMAAKEARCNSSSSSSNLYHHHHHHGAEDKGLLTEMEFSAAEQLMQLSGSSSSSCGSKKRRRSCSKGVEDDEEGGDKDVEYQSQLSVITCAKIQEIFGEEDDDDQVQDFRPMKKKKTTKYRCLADIYFTTKPIDHKMMMNTCSTFINDRIGISCMKEVRKYHC